MPYFNVEWTMTTEWVVEAKSAREVRIAAIGVLENDLDWSDPEVSVSAIHKPKDSIEVDAVLVDGELLDPEEAENKRYCSRLSALNEDQEYLCPACGKVGRLKFAFDVVCGERVGIRCPNLSCHQEWDIEDVAPPPPPEDKRQLQILKESEYE